MQKEILFSDLERSDLFVDGLYKGGTQHGHMGDEALSKLIPGCSNSGGFRVVRSRGDKIKIAYVVLYTTMNKIEWPDYLDRETGVFRYYGDNKTGGELLQTKKRGNQLLQNVFGLLNTGKFQDIPLFLIFCSGKGRDVQFLGLAAPGVPTLSPDRELVAFWRTLDNQRFQNYEAYFTVLDTGETPVLKQWLCERYEGRSEADRLAPNAWRKFQREGRRGIHPLKAKVIDTYPNWFSQVQSNAEGTDALKEIRRRYSDGNAYGFEACATDILLMADPNFVDFKLTRPWRDGGRDAIGYYQQRLISPSFRAGI